MQTKYAQISREILKRITSEEFAAGSRVPSETELLKLYKCSKNTVDKAMESLVASGYIRRERGRGSFVTGVLPPQKIITGLFYFEHLKWLNSLHRQIFHNSYASEFIEKNKLSDIVFDHLPNRPLEEQLVYKADTIEFINLAQQKYFIENRVLFNCNEALERCRVNIYKAYDQGLLELCGCNGLLQAVPIYQIPIILIYNKTVFSNLGLPLPDDSLNWDSFLELNRIITAERNSENEPQTYAFGCQPTLNRLLPFIWQNDAEILPSGRGSAEQTCRVTEAIKWYLELMRINNLRPGLLDQTQIGAQYYYLMQHNRLAMMAGQPYDVQVLLSMGCDIGVTFLPKGRKSTTLILTKNFGVHRDSPVSDAAALLLARITSDAGVQFLKNNTWMAPADSRQLDGDTQDSLKSVIYAACRYGRYTPANLSDYKTYDGFSQMMNKILLSGCDIIEAVRCFEKSIDSVG